MMQIFQYPHETLLQVSSSVIFPVSNTAVSCLHWGQGNFHSINPDIILYVLVNTYY